MIYNLFFLARVGGPGNLIKTFIILRNSLMADFEPAALSHRQAPNKCGRTFESKFGPPTGNFNSSLLVCKTKPREDFIRS